MLMTIKFYHISQSRSTFVHPILLQRFKSYFIDEKRRLLNSHSLLPTNASLANDFFVKIIIVKTYKQNRRFFEQLFFTLDDSPCCR
jgi:hypothetical protein